MKNRILLILIHVVTFSAVYSQNVNGLLFDATNTATRDASAAFEINANTNTPASPLYGGLLLPRVALTGTTDVTTIAGTESTSLLVYNTATAGDVTPGFYYWVAAPTNAWQRIISGNSNFPTGTGTQNYVTKWNNAAGTTIGNSQIVDNATNVGVGMGTGAISKLHSSGTLTVGAGTTAQTVGNVQITTGGASPISNRLTYGTDGTGWKFAIAKNQGGTVTEQLTIMDGGNVGIGSNTPGAKLSVTGGINWNGNGTSEFSELKTDQGGSIELGGTNSLANPIASGTPYIDYHFGTGSAQDYNIRMINSANNRLDIATNSSGNVLTVSGANVGIGTTVPSGKLHIVGDFYNQNMEGLNSTTTYNLAWDATAQAVDFGATDYVTLVKSDVAGTSGSSVLIVANVNVVGNTLTMAQGGGCCPGNNQVPSVVWLANGTASYSITVQRATDAAFTAGLTNLVKGSAMVGLQVGDYYMQAQASPILNANGFSGNRFLYGNNVSLTYFDDPVPGTYYYRLLIEVGGFQKNGGNYSVNDRSFTVAQIKR
jgi:hypothetical protein